MTPEKALAILEGKIPHREPHKDIPSSSIKKAQFKEMEIEEMEITENVAKETMGKTQDLIFIKILASVLMIVGLVVICLWRLAVVSESSYKRGFDNGVQSISPNLLSAQKDINDKIQQMNQLQQNLESMTQQKEQLAQNLKEAEESLPNKISAVIGTVEKRSEQKINQLTEESQKKISDLNNQLALAQKNIDDKVSRLDKMQQELQSETLQKDQLAQSLKKMQASLLAKTSAPTKPIAPTIEPKK